PLLLPRNLHACRSASAERARDAALRLPRLPGRQPSGNDLALGERRIGERDQRDMPLRFRRSITLIKGVTLNLSKSGASVSMGPPGAHGTVGRNGVRATAGVPGSGLSYTTGPMHMGHDDHAAPGAEPGVNWNKLIGFAIILFVVGYFVVRALS